MIIDKQQLLEAVKKVLPGVDSGKNILEGAESIIFSEKGIHSYNTRISVTAPLGFEDKLNCAVNGKDLYNLLKTKNKDIECKIIAKEDCLKLSGENWSGTLKYIEIEFIKDKIDLLNLCDPDKDLPEDFSNGLSMCYIAGNKKNFNGVYVKDQYIYSTNRQVMNIYTMKSEVEEFWIGQDSVKEFTRLKSMFVKYALTSSIKGDWVHFKDNEGTVFSVALKDTNIYKPALTFMEGNRNTLKKDSTDISGSLPEGFGEAIQACAVMASQTDDTKQKHLQLVISAGALIVRGAKSAGKLQYMLEWGDDVVNLPEGKEIYSFLAGDLHSAHKKVTEFFIKPITGTEDTLMVFHSDSFITVLINTK